MGTADSYTKEYMKDSRIFADVYNFLLGKKVIDPAKLSPVDVEELYISTKLPGDTDNDVKKFRDVMKKYATAMTDERASYVLLGIENQTMVDRAMSARILIYDAMRYYKQLQEIAAAHRAANDSTSSEDFISGFHKTDRLKPVITVVVYYGNKPWDASCDLFGLFDNCYEEFLPLMNNYRIKVFEAATMSDEELQTLETSLRYVMTFIKDSNDMEKLNEVIENDEGFRRMDKLSVCVINAVTDAKIKFDETEETVDMCQAIRDMRNTSMAEGEARGRAEGKVEGAANEKRKMAQKMLSDGFSFEQITKYSELSIEEIKKLSANKPL